jgi:hypothetical protein
VVTHNIVLDNRPADVLSDGTGTNTVTAKRCGASVAA